MKYRSSSIYWEVWEIKKTISTILGSSLSLLRLWERFLGHSNYWTIFFTVFATLCLQLLGFIVLNVIFSICKMRSVRDWTRIIPYWWRTCSITEISDWLFLYFEFWPASNNQSDSTLIFIDLRHQRGTFSSECHLSFLFRGSHQVGSFHSLNVKDYIQGWMYGALFNLRF